MLHPFCRCPLCLLSNKITREEEEKEEEGVVLEVTVRGWGDPGGERGRGLAGKEKTL